jgi:ribosomal protein S18 acetylase RimI-like enzyme
MAVDPELQGTGIGTALLTEMERRLEGTARLIVIETAGRPDYADTRAFYQARGYRPAATIADFYGPGDDQMILVKYLSGDWPASHSERSEESARLPMDIGART